MNRRDLMKLAAAAAIPVGATPIASPSVWDILDVHLEWLDKVNDSVTSEHFCC